MSATRLCSQCGAALPAASLGERCPRCVFQFALDPAAAEEGVAPAGDRPRLFYFGDYELLGEIARGGMGVVYKARQVSLNRTVAVKMLLAGPFSSEDYVKRFRTEAEAAANLQHPNIVAIHEVAEHDGRQYFSMEHIEGQNLAELVQQQPLPAGHAARLTQTIAEAVHYAHQRGIIHRDLKPSNILLDSDGQPRVTDFGLAKFVVDEDEPPTSVHSRKPGRWDGIAGRTSASTAANLTLTGQVLGTPGFMPPEQASGRRGAVTKASDVYSLGAILYFLLTGRAPFAAHSAEATLRQVFDSEPISPRVLNREVPRDLDVLCLRCLEKEPRNRFASAQELAEELGRFLAGKPIQSRPVSAAEKLWRWSRRHPAIAALVLALCGAVGAGFLGIQWQLRQTRANELAARRNAYAADMSLAQVSLEANNLRRARELLDRNRPRPGQRDLRGWEWRRLWQECQSDAVSSRASGLKYPLSLRPLPEGSRWFVGTHENRIATMDFAAGTFSIPTALQSSRQPAVLVVSADGKWVAMPGKSGVVEVRDRDEAHPSALLNHSSRVTSLSFSSDGHWLATSEMDGVVKVWDWRKGELLRTVRTHIYDAAYFGDVAFSPTGSWLAIGGANGRLRLIDAATGEEKWIVAAHKDRISALAFSPDGRLLASGAGYADYSVKVWDATTGEARAGLEGHSAWITGLAFSPDGARLASSSADQTVRLWEMNSWQALKTFRGHLKEVHCLAFVPGGETLASADQDGIINLWRTAPDARRTYPVVVPTRSTKPCFSPDETRLFMVDRGEVVTCELATFHESERLPQFGTNNSSLALSPDGRLLAVVDREGGLKVWSVAAQQEVTNLAAHAKGVSNVEFAPDGRMLFTVGLDRTVKHWRASDWSEAASWQWEAKLGVYRSKLLPRHGLWASQHDGQVKLWNLADGRRIAVLPAEDSLVDDVDISPDGKWFVAGVQNGSVILFDTRTWKAHVTLRGHVTGVHGVAFSPDDSRLATGSEGREAVKLWDTATWQELATLPGQGSLFRVAFSPGGTILAASSGRRMNFWRAPSFEEIQRAEKVGVSGRGR
ncbi:MAG: protein kinase [Verrucomicrobia subdivision 3 bacterium]|nr:protein kinase [Limisphaerales bacterium]